MFSFFENYHCISYAKNLKSHISFSLSLTRSYIQVLPSLPFPSLSGPALLSRLSYSYAQTTEDAPKWFPVYVTDLGFTQRSKEENWRNAKCLPSVLLLVFHPPRALFSTCCRILYLFSCSFCLDALNYYYPLCLPWVSFSVLFLLRPFLIPLNLRGSLPSPPPHTYLLHYSIFFRALQELVYIF